MNVFLRCLHFDNKQIQGNYYPKFTDEAINSKNVSSLRPKDSKNDEVKRNTKQVSNDSRLISKQISQNEYLFSLNCFSWI